MVTEGDTAPAFSAPAAKPTGDIDAVDLPAVTAEGPTVVAFVPGAFTSVCTTELVGVRDRLAELDDAGADRYGVSIDSPFALQAFADQHDLGVPLIGDTDKELIDAFDVRIDFDALDVSGVAKRAVFVLDADGTVTHAWVSDDPAVEPDYDAVLAAAAEA